MESGWWATAIKTRGFWNSRGELRWRLYRVPQGRGRHLSEARQRSGRRRVAGSNEEAGGSAELVAGWTLHGLCANQPGNRSGLTRHSGNRRSKAICGGPDCGNRQPGAVLSRRTLARLHFERVRPERDLRDPVSAILQRREMAGVERRRRAAALAAQRQRAVLYFAGLENDVG